MPSDTSDTPVPGDGVLTIPLDDSNSDGDSSMPMDLPEGVGQLMMTETAANVQQSNRNSRGVFDIAMGALAANVGQGYKDVGAVEGRTISGLLATPLASPTSRTA